MLPDHIHGTLTERAAPLTIRGGEEGDVPVAGSVVPFPCPCPIGAIAQVQLHFCGLFKSCPNGSDLTARANYDIMVL